MGNIKKHIKFHYQDNKKAFAIFWGILILVNILGYIISYVTSSNILSMNDGGNYSAVASNIFSICIFMLVIIILMNTEVFSAIISFSSTRGDFYKGSIVYHVLFSGAMALVQTILFKIESMITLYLGGEVYHGFGSNGIQVFFALLFLSAVVNLITIISYKIGYWIWILISAVFAVICSISILRTNFINILNFIFSNNLAYYCLNITIASIILFYFGWLCIRRVDLKIKS